MGLGKEQFTKYVLPLLGILSFAGVHLYIRQYNSNQEAIRRQAEEAKQPDVNGFLIDQLEYLAAKFDKNGDGALSGTEMIGWYHLIDIDDKASEADETWQQSDQNGNGVVTLDEYMSHMSFMAEDEGFKALSERRFTAADQDKNKLLTQEEFAIFLFPELSSKMTSLLYEEEMLSRDGNGDGVLSLYEFLGIKEDEYESKKSEFSIANNAEYFNKDLDKDHDGVLDKPEVLLWVSDNTKHFRQQAVEIVSRLDLNGDGKLDIDTEILPQIEILKDNELTKYGDLLLYSHDEL